MVILVDVDDVKSDLSIVINSKILYIYIIIVDKANNILRCYNLWRKNNGFLKIRVHIFRILQEFKILCTSEELRTLPRNILNPSTEISFNLWKLAKQWELHEETNNQQIIKQYQQSIQNISKNSLNLRWDFN